MLTTIFESPDRSVIPPLGSLGPAKVLAVGRSGRWLRVRLAGERGKLHPDGHDRPSGPKIKVRSALGAPVEVGDMVLITGDAPGSGMPSECSQSARRAPRARSS